MAVRALRGQHVRQIALEGDLRFLPVTDLWQRAREFVVKLPRRKPRRRTASPRTGTGRRKSR